MKPIAIIPARGGSKRIPQKNIKSFFGKPIIQYAIQAAAKSDLFDEIMVSTDDNEIREVALQAGAQVPVLRSQRNSDDNAGLIDVLKEVLETYKSSGKIFPYFSCIYATAALLQPEHLIGAYKKMTSENLDSIIAVSPFGFPIQRALKIEQNKLVEFDTLFAKVRSQDLAPSYHDCGQFFFCNTKSFLNTSTVLSSNTGAYIIPATQAQDIDNEDDWALAEMKYQLFQQKLNTK